MSDTIQLNNKNLKQLMKAFKAGQLPVARVGILGGSKARQGTVTNAEIGARHEYGIDGGVQRSFLRMPITDHLDKELDKAGAFDEGKLKEVVKTGTLVAWVKKVAIVAESVVSQAFDTGGFGKWKPSNMKLKTNHQTLVETQQLRNSITSEVK